MKPYEEPIIAIVFKAFALIIVLIAIYCLVKLDAYGVAVFTALVLGAAPTAWWMGDLLAILGRISHQLEEKKEPAKLAEAKRKMGL